MCCSMPGRLVRTASLGNLTSVWHLNDTNLKSTACSIPTPQGLGYHTQATNLMAGYHTAD